MPGRYNLNRVGILAAATYYGSVGYKPTNEDYGETFGGKPLIDLDGCLRGFRGALVRRGQQPVEYLPGRAPERGQHRFPDFLYSRRVTQFGTKWRVLFWTSEP